MDNLLLSTLFSNMRWDSWELIGLFGEGLFFIRLIHQWLVSEKAGKPVIPTAYWIFSLIGNCLLIAYALRIGSFAVLLPQLVFPIYLLNLRLDLRNRQKQKIRDQQGFDNPDYNWPKVSVIIPVHNEEKVLAATVQNIRQQHYPADKLEIVLALNGCTDNSRDIADALVQDDQINSPLLTIVESDHSGMSFGKNLGAAASLGDILIFVDADTILPPAAVQTIVEAIQTDRKAVVTLPGRADQGGLFVRCLFVIANWTARRKRVHLPGGVMATERKIFQQIGGLDEDLPQGTSTDFIIRALAVGATYTCVWDIVATTSIRRFEKTGMLRQLLSWRKNHQALKSGHKEQVPEYDNIR